MSIFALHNFLIDQNDKVDEDDPEHEILLQTYSQKYPAVDNTSSTIQPTLHPTQDTLVQHLKAIGRLD